MNYDSNGLPNVNHKKARGISLAIIGCIFWGSSGTLAAYIFKTTHVSSLWVVYLRLLVSGILLLLTYAMINRHSIFKIWQDAIYRKKLLMFSLLGIMPSQLLYFVTIRFVNPATATILQFTSPIFILIYLSLSFRQWPNLKGIISILMAVGGTFLLATRGNIHSLSISKIGLIFGLCSGIANAASTILPVDLLKKYDPKLVCGWAMVIGSFPLLPSFITSRQPHLSTSFIIEMLFIIIFGTMIAYLCYITSIGYLDPELAGILSAFEPLTTTILSVVFLNLELHISDIIGGGLILLMTFIQSMHGKNSQ